MNVWQFRSYTVSLEDAARLCRAHGVAAPRAVHRFPKGEVSASFLLDLADGDQAVLKVFCRSHDSAPLRREEAALSALRGADVAVPRWSRLDVSGTVLPYPCTLRELIGGDDGDDLYDRAALSDRLLLLHRAGEALAAVHRAGVDETRNLLADGLYPAAAWAERTGQAFHTALDGLRQQGWIDPRLLHAAESAWRTGEAALYEPFEPVLLHRDFQLWNLRVDPDSLAVNGILDFDEAGFGPACADARDLEINHFVEQPELRRAFWRGYGAPPPAGSEAERLRLSAIVRALSLLWAYWGPTANVSPATVWLLLAPWATADCEEVWVGD